MTPEQRELINRVTVSLETEPHKWTRNRYRATHESGALSVWVVNGPDFVRIEEGDYGLALAGGKNAVFFGWLVPWRRRLFRAASTIPTDEPNRISQAIVRANLAAA